MPSGTQVYKGTPLNKKISRKENVGKKKEESFNELCSFYGLDPNLLNAETDSKWRFLCERMMEDLIPAFQVKSEPGPKEDVDKDAEIYFQYQSLNSFHAFDLDKDQNIINEEPLELIKTNTYTLATRHKMTYGQIRAAIYRTEARMEKDRKSENPIHFFIPK